MKFFLSKVAVFLMLWAVAYTVIYFAVPKKLYANTDYKITQAIFKKVNSGGLTGNILIGDSKPEIGINAHTIHAVNFCMGGTCPIEGYYVVKKILENKTNHIDTLYISYSYKHLILGEYFYWGDYMNDGIDHRYLDSVHDVGMKLNDERYDLSKSYTRKRYDKLISKPSNSAAVRNLNDFLFNGTLNAVYENAQKPAFDAGNQFTNGRITVKGLDTIKFKRPKDQKATEEDLINPKQSVMNTVFFQNILDVAKAHQVKVVYIVMPSQKLTPGTAIQDQKNKLQQTFGKDLLQDTSAYPETYFRDNSGHLNVVGIKKFETFLQNRLYGK